MRLLWITDSHLDVVRLPKQLGKSLRAEGDALVLSGDISEGKHLESDLEELARGFRKPIYFVLGNHDYMGTSFGARNWWANNHAIPNVTWLRGRVVPLSDKTALVGHEGWYDGVFGNAMSSQVIMPEWLAIAELVRYFEPTEWVHGDRRIFLDVLRSYAIQAAQEARTPLEEALKTFPNVMLATHFPPFQEVARHNGKPSDSHWLPWFSSAAMGMMLLEVAQAHPDRSITVLCGHTHDAATYQPLPNLTVHAGKSVYSAPQLAGKFEV